MLPLVLMAIGVIGFSAAAYMDLKTTEFPDWLPYSIILSTIGAVALFSIFQGTGLLIETLVTGGLFLAFGLGLYFTKQWGDGDAWLLGAMGFIIPGLGISAGNAVLPYQLVVLFNFFILSFIYLVAYSLALGFMNPKASRKFLRDLRGDARGLVGIVIGFGAALALALAAMSLQFLIPPNLVLMTMCFPVFLAGLLLFVRYGRFVESELFKRRVPVSRVRVGDVPLSEKWKGLTEKEVKALRKRGGSIVIKEGVRFAPVFVFTLLASFLFGNLIMLFI